MHLLKLKRMHSELFKLLNCFFLNCFLINNCRTCPIINRSSWGILKTIPMPTDYREKTTRVVLTSFDVGGLVLKSDAVKANFGKPKNWVLSNKTPIDVIWIYASNT